MKQEKKLIIKFCPAYPPYQLEDWYRIYKDEGIIKIEVFKAKTKKECQDKLKEILRNIEGGE